MSTPAGAPNKCDVCGGPCAEDFQSVCDWCWYNQTVGECGCYHDERDPCSCDEYCPEYDYCAGYLALPGTWADTVPPSPSR
jgi:hypothetical protein